MLAFADEGYREVHVKTDGAMMMARQVLNRWKLQNEKQVPAKSSRSLHGQKAPGRSKNKRKCYDPEHLGVL
jgi:hypothetical protein